MMLLLIIFLFLLVGMLGISLAAAYCINREKPAR
jgi:hypothetical protein